MTTWHYFLLLSLLPPSSLPLSTFKFRSLDKQATYSGAKGSVSSFPAKNRDKIGVRLGRLRHKIKASANNRHASDLENFGKKALGFSFSAAGLMMPYHYGVGVGLRDAGVLIDGFTPLAGSSGGAIAAAALACGLETNQVLNGISRVAEDCREKGALWRMLIPARQLCDEVLPEDAHERMRGNVSVAVFQVFPRPTRLFVNDFNSKQDVVDSLIASSNIPLVLGPSPLVRFRKGLCIDGSFAAPVGSFGCCDTLAERTVRVMPFEPKDFGRLASYHTAQPRDCIAPGVRYGDGFYHTTGQCLQYAAGYPPPSEKDVRELFQLGYRAAELWIDEEIMSQREKLE